MSTKQGKAGEDRAAAYLKRRGYRILGRNIRLGRGELDMIALRDDILVFVEVKAHKSYESALLAVHPDKCCRLQSAAETWLSRNPDYNHLQCRFDLIIISPRIGLPQWVPAQIKHMEDIIR